MSIASTKLEPLVKRKNSESPASSSTTAAGSSSAAAAAAKRRKRDGTTEASGDDGEEVEMRRGLKVTSRVHRACTACRKQKMRCEGPANGPCRRCATVGVPCVFSKPAREPVMLAEAGNERLQGLERQMAGIQSVLADLISAIKGKAPEPKTLPPPPSMGPRASTSSTFIGSPALATSPGGPSLHGRSSGGPSPSSAGAHMERVVGPTVSSRWGDRSMSQLYEDEDDEEAAAAERGGTSSVDAKETDLASEDLGAPIEALRGLADAAAARRMHGETSAGKRASQQQRPRQIAEGPVNSSGLETSRTSPEPELHKTPPPPDLVESGVVSEDDARRYWAIFGSGCSQFVSIFDVTDESFREASSPLFNETRSRSRFLFDTIVAVGARVSAGSDVASSHVAKACLDAAKAHARRTLFSSTSSIEDCQAMILLASYLDDGYWLLCGHACRMAQELGLDKAFLGLMELQEVRNRATPNPAPSHSPTSALNGAHRLMPLPPGYDDAKMRKLAKAARVWAFVYLLEHQLSYGAGRPTMLSHHWVRNCRTFLTLEWPLSLPTDARFVSTLELMVIREQRQELMFPFDAPVDAAMAQRSEALGQELAAWRSHWTEELAARGFSRSGFFVQSLALQGATARLYLCCTALRGVRNPADVAGMAPHARKITSECMRAAAEVLEIATGCDEYLDALQWAPHYTHVTATFACVYLLKGVRLGVVADEAPPPHLIFRQAERLALQLKRTPGSKYGRVILRMLWAVWRSVAARDKARGLTVMFGAQRTRAGSLAGGPGTITPANVQRGEMSEEDFETVVRLLQLDGDGNSAGTSHGAAAISTPFSSSGPVITQQAQVGFTPMGGPFDAASSSHASADTPLQLPLWVQESAAMGVLTAGQLDMVGLGGRVSNDAAGNASSSGAHQRTPSSMASTANHPGVGDANTSFLRSSFSGAHSHQHQDHHQQQQLRWAMDAPTAAALLPGWPNLTSSHAPEAPVPALGGPGTTPTSFDTLLSELGLTGQL